MKRQLTRVRDDSDLHLAVRGANLDSVLTIISGYSDEEWKELLSKQNHSGETALYIAAEYGYVDIVKEIIKYCDIGLAGIKARNGSDAFHIAAKHGHLDVLKALIEAIPELSMTVDQSNTTALHGAASQGHVGVVNFLLEQGDNLATIAKSNGKTALHSAARNGHLEVVKTLLSREPNIAARYDKKGQTALHMAVKGHNLQVVDELVQLNPSLMNMADSKGNTALHIATRKGRLLIVQKLLNCDGIDSAAMNKSRETALDTAERSGNCQIADILRDHGVPSGKSINSPTTKATLELKRTVRDIKYDVHNQIEHTRRTRKRVQGIAKRLNKMHTEGLNNAINSTTVAAVLIATVAFAAIFQLPGQFEDNPDKLPPNTSLGQAKIASKHGFMIFIIFDSAALFISLAVVVVQTSVVVIERKAKKQMMAVINKLMWLACVLISVAYLALAYVVVGHRERWMALTVTGIGTLIMAATLGTMSYWVIMHRLESSKFRSHRRSLRSSGSASWSLSRMPGSENEYKTVYAI